MKITDRAKAIFDSTNTMLMVLAAIMLLAVTLAVSVDIILRSSLGVSFTGLFELTEYSLLWMTFLGTAWLLKKDGHVCIDLVLNRLNPRPRAITNIVISIICTILFGIITWYSARITLQDYQTGLILESVLKPSKWFLEIIIPIGSFLLFIQLLRKTYGHLVSWKVLSAREQTQSDSTPGGKHHWNGP